MVETADDGFWPVLEAAELAPGEPVQVGGVVWQCVLHGTFDTGIAPLLGVEARASVVEETVTGGVASCQAVSSSETHVTWKSDAGHVSGKIIKVHKNTWTTKDIHITRARSPQYEIKISKTDHIAMHKGSALKKQRDWESRAGWIASTSGTHAITQLHLAPHDRT